MAERVDTSALLDRVDIVQVIERYVRMADAFLAQAMAEVSDVAAD